MKSTFLACCIAILLSPLALHAQEGKKMDIEISSAVLKTAEWAGFKYMENLDLAQSGDQKAIKALFEFSGTVDGAEALQHATTCLELIPLATDEKVGSVISSLKPKLIQVLLNRLQLAQGKTQKEELHKPMQEWAPLTWKALHGERVTCGSCMHEGGGTLSKPTNQRPQMPASQQASELDKPSGKQ